MPVTTRCKDYSLSLPIWEKVATVIAGEEAVKDAKTKFLPKPNASDTSPENEARYKALLLRAYFFNATGRTHRGFVGQMTQKEPSLVAPPEMDNLVNNVDGRGTTLKNTVRSIVSEVMSSGRAGLLADMPTKADGQAITREDISVRKLQPIIRWYRAVDITNWRTTVINGVRVLTMVTLRETHEVQGASEFDSEEVTFFRVLTYDVDTGVRARIFETKGSVETVTSDTIMKDHSGAPLTSIPFVFTGVEGNDPDVGMVPLLDMANVNISHYRNGADAEETSYLMSQPTLVLAGVDEEWINTVLGGKIGLGSRSAIFLPEKGTADLIQVDENNLAVKLMDNKEKQMVALGAQLVEAKTVSRTATETSLEASTERSVLGCIVHNIVNAMQTTLRRCLAFVSGTAPDDTTLKFTQPTDFEMLRMSSADRSQLISEWQAGAIDYEEVRTILKKAGVAFKDNDEVRENVANEITQPDTSENNL